MFYIHYIISVTEKLKCKNTKNIILGMIILIIQYCITAIIFSIFLPHERTLQLPPSNKKYLIVITYKSITYTNRKTSKIRIFFATIRAFFR